MTTPFAKAGGVSIKPGQLQFDIVVTTLFNDAAKVGKKARLRTIRDLDAAALQPRRAGSVLMDEGVKDDAVREAAFARRPDDGVDLLQCGRQCRPRNKSRSMA